MSVKREHAGPKRRYVSPLRQQQAKDTVGRIVDAAARLFVERGYLATSIADVAVAAQVSERTVYTALGSKPTLLFAVVDAAIAADSGPDPISQRAWFREVIDEPDPKRKLELFATVVRGIHERTSRIFKVIQEAAAADESLAQILTAHRDGQTADEGLVIASLPADALLPGLGQEDALETMWALTTPDFYAQVADRGWTPDRYERWLADTLVRLLLRPGTQARQPRQRLQQGPDEQAGLDRR